MAGGFLEYAERIVMSFMNITGESLNSLERVTVPSFDEMKISSVYEYDPKEDEVIGPHSSFKKYTHLL